MIPVAPTWALFGAAVHAPADPHLAIGAHLRFQPSRRIGLPVTPLFVSRLLVREALAHADRTDIAWFDEDDQPVTAPFTVVPGKPIRGRLPHPANGVCSWLEVGAPAAGLTVEARITTPRGPAVVSARSQPRYVVSAQRIEDIIVRGSGTVAGVRWLDVAASPLLASESRPWRILSLPVKPAPRYAPTANAVAEAWARVTNGAPRRASLIQNPAVANPAAAALTAPQVDVARLQALSPAVDQHVLRLLNDLSDTPYKLADTSAITGTIKSTSNASASVPILGRVLQSLAEPSLARYLGFADVDPEIATADVGSLVVYHARAGWQIDAGWMDMFAAMLGTTEQTIAQFVADVPEAANHPFGAITKVWPLAALAVSTAGIPSDPPSAPAASPPDDRGWRADLPAPDVRRVVGLPIAGLAPAASLSLARQAGAKWLSKNPLAPGSDTLRLALVPSVKPADPASGHGYLIDRDVGPGAATWRIGQADWFGRWSTWATATAAAKARALPPVPVIELGYQPSDGGGVDLLAGKLTIVVPVPAAAELPPGSNLLASLQLTISDGVLPSVTISYPLGALPPDAVLYPASATQPFARLIIQRKQPALAVGEWRWVEVAGRWQDTAAAMSPTVAPVKIKAIDPRAPAPPALPTELLYSARPDVTGKARFAQQWTAPATSRYRVYFTTEANALEFLATALPSAAQQLLALEAGAERAGGFRDPAVVAALDYGAFECVSRTPILPDAGSAGFEHTLSGSLEGLALYKIVAESEHGVVSPFESAPLLTVAVPNHGAPSRPLVSVTRRPPVGGVEVPGVLVTVTVPRSRTTIAGWRLRRSITGRGDPRQFPVVASGILPPEPAPLDPRATTFVITDEHDLRPWTVYRWSVEVQAGPPPGAPDDSPVPIGEWSAPGVPARWSVTPPPPPPPAGVVATPIGSTVELAITLDPSTPVLRGTPRGAYTLEVVRQSDRKREVLALPIGAAINGVMKAVDAAPLCFTEAGQPPVLISATYAVRIIDPVGRASAFTATQP